MLKNYLSIAIRNLRRNAAHSFINIIGLSVGMAVAMLIGFWIYDEASFNKSFVHHDRIGVVARTFNYNSQRISLPGYCPYQIREELLNKYSADLRSVVLSTGIAEHLIANSSNTNFQKKGSYMDAGAAEMLSLRMLKGSREGLRQPAGVFLSASVAATIFGNADPLGKTLHLDGQSNALVTGVYEDIPYNSDFRDLGFIASVQLFIAANPGIKTSQNPWIDQNFFTAYVQLSEQADEKSVSLKIKDLLLGQLPDGEYKIEQPVMFLQPMDDWHLYADFENYTGYKVREKIEYVRLMAVIGIFILLLACVNFINLSTARSEKRAKEVGIRKTIGSLRSQLISQFLLESLLAVGFAFLLSMLWVVLALPAFNKIADKQIDIPWGFPVFWIVCVLFSLLTGLISGLYPALYLSSFEPVKVLKGTFRTGPLAAKPRRILIVFQFTVSVGLIICTTIIYRQIQFAFSRPIGYDRGGLIMINITPDIRKNYVIIRDELKRSKAIVEMGASQNSPTDFNAVDNHINWKGKDPRMNADFALSNMTLDYGKTIGWQILEGRDFSPEFLSDSTAFVINESAAKQMGFKHPIGETVIWNMKPFHVIGMIKDIVFESPFSLSVSPSIYHISGGDNYVTTLKLNPQLSTQQALTQIRTVFTRYNPIYSFDYRFVDKEYAKKFNEEETMGQLSGFFTLLAIFISCLGLFGMAAFTAEQRRKEIGVRKTLGASVFNLWRLLSKEYIILVTISLVIATPITYYFMHNWLQQYEYRYKMSWFVFIAAGLGAMLIALLTISYQVFKAALASPVKSLRTE